MSTIVIGGHRGIGKEIVDTLGDGVCVHGEQDFDLRKHGSVISQAIYWELLDKQMLGIKVDGIVYNSGVNTLMQLGKVDFDTLDEIFSVNVKGFIAVLDGIARASAHLCETSDCDAFRGMSVVGVSSVAHRVPMTHSVAYCSSKAAFDMAARVGARELARIGIRVNTVSPGPVEGTDMTNYIRQTVPHMRGMTPEEAEQYQMSAIPMRRRLLKSEVAAAVQFLLSDAASGITGADISVSGGL